MHKEKGFRAVEIPQVILQVAATVRGQVPLRVRRGRVQIRRRRGTRAAPVVHGKVMSLLPAAWRRNPATAPGDALAGGVEKRSGS